MDAVALAQRFHHDVHAAAGAGVAAEPEAQLTTPVSNLFRAVAASAGLGSLTLLREQRTGRTRPDFGVLQQVGKRPRQRGYIELKAPSVSVDTATWTGRNREQWQRMAVEAEVLVVCNGRTARLYLDGEVAGLDAPLPFEAPEEWDPAPLAALLRRFVSARCRPVRSVVELSRRLAWRTADLRDKLLWLLDEESEAGDLARAQLAGWRTAIHLESTPRDFADGISQVVSYGMVLAVLTGTEADTDGDGLVRVEEARAAIRGISPVMSAAFGPLLEQPLYDAVRVELGHLEGLVSAIDLDRVRQSSDARGEPWLYFYEDFLGVYAPDARKQAGVYYTPTAVVEAMVAMVDHVLVERFGCRAGLADSGVVTLDPAVGTGTFPLAVIDRAAARMEALRGPAGPAQAAANLAENLVGFEVLPGPYAVAHLRLTQRLRELDPTSGHQAKVILTDTLETPEGLQDQISLFGAGRVLALEQNRAKRVKAQQRVTVVLGNPPYRRLARDVSGRGAGGWLFEPLKRGRGRERSLFDDVLDVAKKHTIFSHHASLYNLYVYFWRWALWKAFEAHGSGPGVVAFITGSSWLRGPGFVGLRQLVRERCDEAWILDLGGDNKGANSDENVFAIETPVAVVVLVRTAAHDPKRPARLSYRRVEGTRAEKLAALDEISKSAAPLGGPWETVEGDLRSPFVPAAGSAIWQDSPRLADLFPWQQPGCKVGRTWPISPSRGVLEARWRRLMAAPVEERPEAFKTSKHGRNIFTDVAGLPRLADEPTDAASQAIVLYGYRSYDRQYTFADPRLAALERPSLWQSHSDDQVFLVAPMTKQVSAGPCCVVTAHIPDLDFFRGSFGGKDVIPLYRDAEAREPNVTRKLLSAMGEAHGTAPPSPEDLLAYVVALLSAPAYQSRFAAALETPGPRVPLTADPALWQQAVALGRRLAWLQTGAARFRGEGRGRVVPLVEGLVWKTPVQVAPETLRDVTYDAELNELRVGDGVVSCVLPEVWGWKVSKMAVVSKWLGYRTTRGAGRAASSKNVLDRIRPTTWEDAWNDELLDLLRVLTLSVEVAPEQAALLHRICDGPLLSAGDLPQPSPKQRKPPKKV